MRPIKQAIENFFKTTTLHGFKYLVSQYYSDRIGWALCCLASACCAGVLCVVLWHRFQVMPALLQLRDLSDLSLQPLPSVAFCQPPDTVAETFLKHLNTKGTNTTRLPATLVNALQGKNTDEAQVDLLEEVLKWNDVSLLEMLMLYTPDCTQSIRECRWRDVPLDCARLFKKELTSSGVCCVATPTRFANTFIPVLQRIDRVLKLDVGLQCVQGSKGLEVFTNYFGEEWIVPTLLSPGYNYLAHLTFTSEKDHDDEKLVDGTCISSKEYSRGQCLLKCVEKICGCSDPFRKLNRHKNEDVPPPCPLKRLSCLRTYGSKDNTSCACLPACQKIITKLVLESGSYKLMQWSLDPIYSGLNDTHSLVLRLKININASKSFLLKPTETWLTLLSSLGGVFNMFLGVGLFSALEFLFLLLVKIPIAIRRSSQIAPTTRVMFDRVY